MEKMIVPHYSINDNMNPTKGMMTCTLTKRGQRHEPQWREICILWTVSKKKDMVGVNCNHGEVDNAKLKGRVMMWNLAREDYEQGEDYEQNKDYEQRKGYVRTRRGEDYELR